MDQFASHGGASVSLVVVSWANSRKRDTRATILMSIIQTGPLPFAALKSGRLMLRFARENDFGH